MYYKLIKNDIKKSKFIAATTTLFIMAAALLTALAAILTVNLTTAIDGMMEKAQTPHFLQMHSGEIDMERLLSFVEKHQNVEDFQVRPFLNIEGAEIYIGEATLADSVQDNGLTVQSERFDYLLGLDGSILAPLEGEMYVPLYYMKNGKIALGDKISIYGVPFTVVGFLRDSQMNAAMISSKRFLVNPNDFNKVQAYGTLESLIEFRLKDQAGTAAFETEYLEAGLPANGPPAITHSLFKMANAVSDGMMIAVLLLIGVLVTAVSFLCIRFTLLAKVEEDYREIGVLKAIGLRVQRIKRLYLAKYGALAGVGCVAGYVLALFVKEPFLANIRLYMGEGKAPTLALLLGVAGAGLVFIVVLLYVNNVLRRFKKLSAAQAIRFGAPEEKHGGAKALQLSKNRIFSVNSFLGIKDVFARKKLYALMLMVLIISSFLMIVPQNIYNTIAQRNFMTYMGIGECDMRIDIQQTADIAGKTAEISRMMAADEDIVQHTVLTSYMFDMEMRDGTVEKLKVELGDHSVFPVAYSEGKRPQNATEISISALVAADTEKGIGDTILLTIDGKQTALTICGIYSDITNGGKTAKAVFETTQANILWSILPVQLRDSRLVDQKVEEYKTRYPYVKVANIEEYLDQSFGTTVAAIQKASFVAIVVAVFLTTFVTLLFMRMLVVKDRASVAVLIALGFPKKNIQRQYVVRAVILLVLGVVLGTLLANTLGELVGVGLISQFGASSFHFQINPWFAYGFSPLLMVLCVLFATKLAIREISTIKMADHL